MSFTNSGPGWDNAAERREEAMRGNAFALYDEQQWQEGLRGSNRNDGGASPSLTPSVPLWPILALALVVAVIGALLAGLVLGVEWLATSSPIAPLFAAPGDGLARYLIGTATLLALVPGTLVAVASSLRDGRLRRLSTPLVVVAVLLVPILLWATQQTSTAAVGRI